MHLISLEKPEAPASEFKTIHLLARRDQSEVMVVDREKCVVHLV